MNDKGITSGYGGKIKVAGIKNNKGIILLYVADCKVNDTQITLLASSMTKDRSSNVVAE